MKRIILFLVLLLAGCSSTVDWENEPQGSVKLSHKTSQHTPNGAYVYSGNGISQEQLSAIDTGLQLAFTDAISSGYSVGMNSNQYMIGIPVYPCVPSPIQGVPSFKIKANDYDGTEFDVYNPKGAGVRDGIGVILASEMVLSLTGDMVVCPDISQLKNAVRNGAEHCLIHQNDQEYYNITWFHGNGFYHPLLPKRTQLKNAVYQSYDGSIIVNLVK